MGAAGTERTGGEATPRRRWAAPALLVLLALLAWAPAVARGGFALDDRELLEDPVVAGARPWTAAFSEEWFAHRARTGRWRPAATLSLALDRALWGADARGFHLTNLALHVAALLLAWSVLVRLGSGARAPALFGLGLVALHPALADAVAWVSGRTVLLAALPCLLAARLLLGRAGGRPLLAAAVAGGGLLVGLAAKEEAAVFALVLPLVAATRGRRAGTAAAVGAAAALAAWLGMRALVLGAALPDAPLAEGAATRAGAAALEALRLAALPLHHPPAVRAARLAAAGPAAAWLGGALWCATFAASAFALLRRRGPLSGALLCASVALAPALLLAAGGEDFAPRYLYLPLLLAAPAVGALVAALFGRARAPLALAVGALMLPLAWSQSRAYASRRAHREAQLRADPGDASAWSDLGLALEAEGDDAGALAAWERAVALDPGASRAWSNLGRAHLERGETEPAERALRAAVRADGANAIARVNLGALLLRTARPAPAAEEYARACALAPTLAAAWRGRARALLEDGRPDAARAALERAGALAPDDPGVRRLRRLLERR